MLQVKTYAGASPLHGLGLFAAEFIPAGRLIWRFEKPDLAISRSDAAILSQHAQALLWRHGFLSGGYWYLGADNDRFTNHSDDPNIGSNPNNSRDGNVYALRDIHHGDELLANYFEFDEDAERKLRTDYSHSPA